MKPLLRLYPRSWRDRYEREMEVLLEELPTGIGVGLDLVLGAAGAYAAVIRGNRFLSACGAFLHGIWVAVLLQSIAFVTFILVAESSRDTFTTVQVGALRLVTYMRPGPFGPLLREGAASLALRFDWLPSAALLAALVLALAFVLAMPRLVRTPR